MQSSDDHGCPSNNGASSDDHGCPSNNGASSDDQSTHLPKMVRGQ